MKYFKFIGEPKNYPFKKGKVYKGSFRANGWSKVSRIALISPENWLPVPKPKKNLSEKIEKLKKQAEKEGMAISFHFEGVDDSGLDVTFNGVCLTISPKPDPNKGIIYQPNTAGGTYSATNPKDEWEGVEFVEVIKDEESVKKGSIYKVLKVEKNMLGYLPNYYNLFEGIHVSEKILKPSTESAYVEQLKAKVKELFGEIKDGDRFDWSELGFGTCPVTLNQGDRDFFYWKELDEFRKGGHALYKQGKWAKKLPKRIEVDLVWDEKIMLGVEMPAVAFHDKTKYNSGGKVESIFTGKSDSVIGKSFKFLASQLEKYLNGEIE